MSIGYYHLLEPRSAARLQSLECAIILLVIFDISAHSYSLFQWIITPIKHNFL